MLFLPLPMARTPNYHLSISASVDPLSALLPTSLASLDLPFLSTYLELDAHVDASRIVIA